MPSGSFVFSILNAFPGMMFVFPVFMLSALFAIVFKLIRG